MNRSLNSTLISLLLVVLSLGAGNPVQAHDPGLSIATANVVGGRLSIRLAVARLDVERLFVLDADHDGRISETEFQAALPALQITARQSFRVTASHEVLPPGDPVITLDSRDGIRVEIPFRGVAIGTLHIQSVLLDRLPRGHRQFLSLRGPNQKLLGEQMLDAGHSLFTAKLVEEALVSSQPHSFREFVVLGVEHIATGYDHLLFLLGLLMVGGRLRSALKIITSFTFAHSITLALATLNIINIPPGIIEPLIAASIVFVGMQNLLCRGLEQRWLLTFGFGLVHGCGFASALRDLGLGADGASIAVPLVSFNVGVELGQLAIAALVLPLIWKCHSSPVFVKRFVPVGSALIVLAGGYWFVARTLL